MSVARVIRATVALLMGAVLAAMVVGSASAGAVGKPFYLKSFGPDGTENTSFGRASSVAVDEQSGRVYVLDLKAETLSQFDLDGQPVSFSGSAPYIVGNEITGLSPRDNSNGQQEVAVDPSTHKIFVTDDEGQSISAFEESGEPALFSAGPGSGTNSLSGFTEAFGVAVDENGAIYVTEHGENEVEVFQATGELITEFDIPTPSVLAIGPGPDGVAYVGRMDQNNQTGVFGDVRMLTPSSFPVGPLTTYEGASDPFSEGHPSEVAVDPTTGDVYVANSALSTKSQVLWYDSTGALLQSFAGPGEPGEAAEAAGVAVSPGSGRIFVSNGVVGGRVEIFLREAPPGPPEVELISAGEVTGDSVRLRARINPHALDTTYRFEYGLNDCSSGPCTSVPLTAADIGSGQEGVVVSHRISGLQPHTTYHYRVVAVNASGSNLEDLPERETETDHEFTTQQSGLGFQLPDGRVWEMVSPPDKRGARLVPDHLGIIQASESGDALAYLSRGSIEQDPAGNRSFENSSVLARRNADGTWSSADITAAHTEPAPIRFESEYKLFSPDLSKALLEPRDRTKLAPNSFQVSPHIRLNGEPGSFNSLLSEANVTSGEEWGENQAEEEKILIPIAGASRDFSHVALESEVPLLAGAPQNAVYMWVDGALEEISRTPPLEGDEFVTARVGSGSQSNRRAVSADGSRVFWSTFSGDPTGLFLRDLSAQASARLDVPNGIQPSGQPRPRFQAASADGSVVFFTDSQRLTEDASSEGVDLYRCEIDAPAQGCASLEDVSSPKSGSVESTEVMGLALSVSADGGTACFVAKGVLDDEPNGQGEVASAGALNLYCWQQGSEPRFVARLSNGDEKDWGGPPPNSMMRRQTATGSPDGRYLSFMSELPLTGHESRNPASGERNEEVFLYDSAEEGLVCVSCDPSGASAVGELRIYGAKGPEQEPVVDINKVWEDRWVAATLPQATERAEAGLTLYQPRAVFDSGRIFFNAVDGLVPADSNHEWDVYQWEPVGTGDCTEGSGGAAVARSGDGCVGLISSGTAEEESGFLDASLSGDDVFFLSRGRLSALDEDGAVDAYDARVDGLPAVVEPLAECAGEACQPLPSAPNDPTPASSAFSGPGNVKGCPRGKHRVRRHGKSVCVRRKHGQAKRHAGKHHGQHSTRPRSGRTSEGDHR